MGQFQERWNGSPMSHTVPGLVKTETISGSSARVAAWRPGGGEPSAWLTMLEGGEVDGGIQP